MTRNNDALSAPELVENLQANRTALNKVDERLCWRGT